MPGYGNDNEPMAMGSLSHFYIYLQVAGGGEDSPILLELNGPKATLPIKRNAPSSLTVPQPVTPVNLLPSLHKVPLMHPLSVAYNCSVSDFA